MSQKEKNKIMGRNQPGYQNIAKEREADLKRMKVKYKLTGQVEFSQTNNWVRVGGETFNAVTKEMFYEIVGGKKRVSSKSNQ